MKVKSNTSWNLLILIILLLAFVLRIYKIDLLLDFHYDQGRDAKIIWDLWHFHKLFLIGPTTGLEGVFLGPFYYYLIAPFYLISGGNPVVPSIFLSFLTVVSLYFLYKSGELIKDKHLGLIALLIGTFSHYIIFSSRWLSNPTPMFLTSILIFYSMLKILKKDKKKNWWYLTFLLIGISLHFEAASAIFYLPVLLIFVLWQRKKINKKEFLISSFLLFSTFLPQLIFNFRHQNILIKNIFTKVPDFGNQTINVFSFVKNRFIIFYDVYSNKLFLDKPDLSFIFIILSSFGVYKLGQVKKNKKVWKLFLIFLGVPTFFYLIYRGNHGVLYDYYFTGYYLILILFFSFGIHWFLTNKNYKYIVYLFFTLFLFFNLSKTYNKFSSDVYKGNDIYLVNQLNAISWVYQNSTTQKFNVDVYVPPVIPHSYDYLFLWYESKIDKKNVLRDEQNMSDVLFILYEVDPPHPERLDMWLDRQDKIAKPEKVATYGGITVERRNRI